MALNPTSSRPSGGSAAPHTQEQFFGPNTSIANDAGGDLSWGTSSGPDSLLNVTVPTLPTVITSGTYAFTIAINSSDLTTGGYFLAQLELDVAGNDVFTGGRAESFALANDPTVSLTAVWYLTAGMQVKAGLTNRDGASARDFSLGAYVQRLS